MSELQDFNTAVIEEFRSNHGRVAAFGDTPVVLLTTTGAKTGTKRLNPLAALVEGDRLYVFASKAGAPTHPDWYHNLVANPEVSVELGDERFDAVAVPVTGPERDRLYAAQAALVPTFADYEKKSDRLIPVVELRHTT